MTLWTWIRGRLGAGPPPESAPPEGAPEVHSGRPEDTGGVPTDSPDAHSTTGTTPSGTFVGRGSGDDAGYLETGAEKRADDHGEEPDGER